MHEYIEDIIKKLPKEQVSFLSAHKAEFVDYLWEHEDWPLLGFLKECAEKHPDDKATKEMLKSMKSRRDK